jgi:hypothetical protein
MLLVNEGDYPNTVRLRIFRGGFGHVETRYIASLQGFWFTEFSYPNRIGDYPIERFFVIPRIVGARYIVPLRDISARLRGLTLNWLAVSFF